MTRPRRGQANLLALVAALLLVTAGVGVALTVAAGSVSSGERDPTDRHLARAVADRLADGSVNVTALRREGLGAELPAGTAVRVVVGDTVVLERGDPGGGAAVERLARAVHTGTENRTLALAGDGRVTLPATRTATLNLTGVRTVRADGRVVLHDPAGLNGTYTLRLPADERATLAFAAATPARADATVTYHPRRVETATVRVVVDA